ncbi:arginine utilization regulatory protein [Desulfocicer vacuolatum DSM 3385]|uniref:Arginine utilization regulatory protein n=1 Tax=Desulfocicer vacuolatum DSM 3385 TaxID=1121400 RepID=A0A1W2D9C5_9BACT|nr:sigma 54-interacting transcriptional regulator [Desulfocicer vacuolatum]SMC94120.1 arginine utilization regulatory protein [Desulfocicer vacuolatum DSM 3385]
MTLDIHLLQKKLGITDNANAFLILRDLHEGVIIADVHGEVLYYNRAMAKIDDLDMDYAPGKKITDIYQLNEKNSTTMACIRTGKAVRNKVIMYRTRLGKMSNVISNVFPLFNSDGKVVGAISFTKDYQMLETIISSDQPKKSCQGKGNGTRYTFSDMVGENGGLFHAVKTAKMASESPSPIMLSGETGTGKELFAQSIHNHRRRSGHKFIPINCAAIPENLLEGILFGTSRGAFTGAIEKSGLFEQANGGTIFLDELDSMPITLQAKLLRVVQEKKVRRLGSLEEIHLDIKIISAVGRDPREIIESGSLRQDLFYRMGVVFIMIPPLRDRRNDMELLVSHFVRKFNGSLGERVTGLSRRVSSLFLNYHWPGNVRELEHVIEGAMNMVNGETLIRLGHLPVHVLNSLDDSGGKGMAAPGVDSLIPLCYGEVGGQESSPSLSDIQNANEHNSLCNALQRSGGNAAGAARMLGISPQSLHYKLKKFKINRKDFIVN